jgi:hypothetical protein
MVTSTRVEKRPPGRRASARVRVGEARDHVAVARARRAPAAERLAGELGQRGDELGLLEQHAS